MIKQGKLLKNKSKILSNLFNEKYRHKLGQFNNTTGTEGVKDRVKKRHNSAYCQQNSTTTTANINYDLININYDLES